MRARLRSFEFAIGLMVLLEAVFIFLMLWNPVIERAIPRESIQSEGGYLYTVGTSAVPRLWGYRWIGNDANRPRRSTLVLRENGVALGPVHTPADIIRSYGKGLFNHWNEIIFFSSSDNSDPRANNRVYVASAPATLQPALLRLLVVITAALAMLLGCLAVSVARSRVDASSQTERTPEGAPRAAGLVIAASKAAALILVGVLGPLLWLPLLWNEAAAIALSGRMGFLALYVAVFVMCVAGLLTAPFLRDWRLRISICVVLIAGFCIDQIIRSISGHPMTLELMNTLWRERAMGPGVLVSYTSAIWPNVLIAAALAAALLFPPIGRWSLSRRFATIPAGALLGVGLIVLGSNGLSEAYPSPYVVPAQVVAQLLYERAEAVERLPVEYERPLRSEFKKIVVVIDESVRGDRVGFNDGKYDNTPFLTSVSDRIANYGIAISGANCSASSRMMMRVGLQKEQLPDVKQLFRRMPTLWQYARSAGYKVAFLDAWYPIYGYHSYMDAKEAAQIDEFRPLGTGGRSYNDDMDVVQALIDVLRRDEKILIYVNKFGLHGPYAARYPPHLDYNPAPLVSALPLDAERRENVASYYRAIHSLVDGFFEMLLPHVGEDTLLIYTSDHGQSLYEGGYDQSHCTSRPDLALGEVTVPLFVIAGGSEASKRFKSEAKRAYNRASHFEIFPTLLESMGYARSWAEHNYGPTLLNVPIERRRGFLLGTLFLSGSLWVNVDIASGSNRNLSYLDARP